MAQQARMTGLTYRVVVRAEELATRQAGVMIDPVTGLPVDVRSPERREQDEATYREMQENAMKKEREPQLVPADPSPFVTGGGAFGGVGTSETVAAADPSPDPAPEPPADPPLPAEEPQPTPPTPA